MFLSYDWDQGRGLDSCFYYETFRRNSALVGKGYGIRLKIDTF